MHHRDRQPSATKMASSGSSLDLGDGSSSGRSSAMSRYAKLRSMGTSGDRPAALLERGDHDSPGVTKVSSNEENDKRNYL